MDHQCSASASSRGGASASSASGSCPRGPHTHSLALNSVQRSVIKWPYQLEPTCLFSLLSALKPSLGAPVAALTHHLAIADESKGSSLGSEYGQGYC
jgi:hypothetical protein